MSDLNLIRIDSFCPSINQSMMEEGFGEGRKLRKRRRAKSSTEDEVVESKIVKAKNKKLSTEESQLALKIFLNPLIMGHITKHLPTETLPKLRRTCKLWNKTMVPEYRKRSPHVISVDKNTVNGITDTLSQSQEIPFGKFKIFSLSFTSPKVQELIGVIGGVLTHLEIGLTSSVYLPISTFRTMLLKQAPVLQSLDVTDLRNTAPRFWKCKLQSPTKKRKAKKGEEQEEEEEEKMQTLPNLKKIALSLYIDDKTNKDTSYNLINDLFNAAINLEVIKVSNYNSRLNLLNGIVLEALNQKTSNLHKIHGIKFGRQISLNNLETLVELSRRKSNRLQLKKFDLRYLADNCFIGHGQFGQSLVNQFLNLQAPFLEKLTASLTYTRDNCKIHLPAMKSLTNLKLQSEFFSPTPQPRPFVPDPPDNMNQVPIFLHLIPNPNNDNGNGGVLSNNILFDSLNSNFPKLSKLTLMDMDWMEETDGTEAQLENRQTKWTQFITQLGSHSGITDLTMTVYDEPSYLMDLSVRFPNVKTLKMDFGHSLFRQVWSAWPNLEFADFGIEFELRDAEVDSVITGIPIPTLKKAKVNASESMLKNGSWKELKTEPGITDLHDLREFNLRLDWCERKSSYITDFSGYYGFAANPSLRRIYVNRSSNFSSSCVRAVESAVGLYGNFIPYDESLKKPSGFRLRWRPRLRTAGMILVRFF